MKVYHELLKDILTNGVEKRDRTGVGTKSVFGRQLRFDLSVGFPLLTTKKVHFKSIVYELLWFLRGESNIRYLKENGVSIWDEWASPDGELGPVYGVQWRSWQTKNQTKIDQLSAVIESLKSNPDSRRHIVSAWNVGEISEMALPPCHVLFQFYVGNGKLSCMLYQRSADVFLGLPFNIASYSLLTYMMAQVCGYSPGEFIHILGDTHLYLNHLEQTKILLSREERPLPQIRLNPEITDLFAFKYQDIELLNYQPHPAISAPVAV